MSTTPQTTRFRFSLAEYKKAERLQLGYCLHFRAQHECCEPDARADDCEACGEPAVHGPHWIVVAGLVE